MDKMTQIKEYQVFDGAASQRVNFLDKSFLAFLDGDYEEYQTPALVTGEILDKCGYFSSFPQQITVVSSINPDCYGEVEEQKAVGREHLSKKMMYLLPAACLHIYPALEHRTDLAFKTITTKVQVFRYEKEFDGNTRLWNFTVREMVFIGERDFVLRKLEECQEKSLALAQEIFPGAKIRPAVDNFYPTSRNKIKEKMQKANNLKYELIFPVQNTGLAVTSFNYHHTHFSQAFNFDHNCRIVTGCVGYGLERWLAACREHNYAFEELRAWGK